MKRIALKMLAVSRQQRGSANAMFLGVLVLAGIVVALAYSSAHPAITISSLLVQLHHIPHIEAIAVAVLGLLFILVLQAYPEIAMKVVYLAVIAAGAHEAMNFGAMQPFLSQVGQLTGHGG